MKQLTKTKTSLKTCFQMFSLRENGRDCAQSPWEESEQLGDEVGWPRREVDALVR